MKTIGFIVLRGQQPCRLYNAAGSLRGGVLVPGTPIQAYAKRRDARRAINRTRRIAVQLSSGLLRDWQPVKDLAEVAATPDPFSIAPLVK